MYNQFKSSLHRAPLTLLMEAQRQWKVGDSCLAQAPGWGARYFPAVVHQVSETVGLAKVGWLDEESCSVVSLGKLLPPPPPEPSKESKQDHPLLFSFGL